MGINYYSHCGNWSESRGLVRSKRSMRKSLWVHLEIGENYILVGRQQRLMEILFWQRDLQSIHNTNDILESNVLSHAQIPRRDCRGETW